MSNYIPNIIYFSTHAQKRPLTYSHDQGGAGTNTDPAADRRHIVGIIQLRLLGIVTEALQPADERRYPGDHRHALQETQRCSLDMIYV